jgi:hypothetical protein
LNPPPHPGEPVCYALTHKFEVYRIQNIAPNIVLIFLRSYPLPRRHELVESSLMSRQTVSRPVRPGRKHSSGDHDQTSTTARHRREGLCGVPPTMKRLVLRPQPLPVIASAVTLGSESRLTSDHTTQHRLGFDIFPSSFPTTLWVTVEALDTGSTWD